MFEFFDHTADLGVRVRAADRNQLFAEAGRALTACLVEDPATVRAAVTESLSVAGDDVEYLLFDWLRELLSRFEARKMLYSQFAVCVDAAGLTAEVAGEPLDPSRHPLGHEVKAITYHGLTVERHGDGRLAEVVVDI
jgi:SHS2 domain-containing protein